MSLQFLNFPPVDFRFKKNEKGALQLFDIIRKKFVDITPEEWVRQHIVHFLINHKNVPLSMISLEKQLALNNTKKRTDIIVYHSTLKPILMIECKSPKIKIDQLTINQAMRYNIKLKVPFIFLSNGVEHICLKLEKDEVQVISELPSYDILKNF